MAISRDSPPQIPSVSPSHTRSSFKIQIWEWKLRILATDTLLWGSYSLCLTLQCGSTDEGNPETPSVRLPPSPLVAGPATTLGRRGDVARFKSSCPWFPGGSNLALVRIACGFLAYLSLFPWQKPWVWLPPIQVIYSISILLLWQMSWPKVLVGSRKQKTKIAAHHCGTSGQEWNRNRIFEQKTWRNTACSFWCR